MRRPQGVLLPPLSSTRVRRGDIYRAIRTAVLGGVLSPGERLPSTRYAAKDYGVSRGMLEEVFVQLTEEGFLERAVGRGTFVTKAVSRLNAPTDGKKRLRPSPSISRRGGRFSADAACREPAVPLPFDAGIADITEFPWRTWYRLQARAARALAHDAFTFADPRGLAAFREAIARYLAQFRGISCHPAQVIVFNSSQQALNAIALLLLDRGDAVWMEDPCYLGARAALELAGAEIIPVPVDEEGISVGIGLKRCRRARLAYVTPSHQYPTGVALSLERRISLLEWTAQNNSWVVEDDYDGEFRYERQPLTALYSLDTNSRVLYLGTMNKSMFVSLRLAYAVVPATLVEPLANVRTQMDGFTSPVQQLATGLFMEDGHFSTHLRNMRSIYAGKRMALIEALSPLRALGWAWPTNPAGMHLLIRHAAGDYVRRVAAKSPLKLALLSSYRMARLPDDGLFLRFGALDVASIRAGSHSLLGTARSTRK